MKLPLQNKLKNVRHRWPILAVLLVGLGIGFLGGYAWQGINNVSEMETALIVQVIDGDTVELANGERVRYLGIDTPETGEYYFLEATARNKELVEGKVVELEQGERDKDAYDRLLRYVYVDGTFVNAELVAQGYAVSFIFNPDERYSQVLVQLEQYAKIRNKGLWANE